MSSVEESRQARIISELSMFIRKVLSDPTVAPKCMEIARKYKGHPEATKMMAEEISASTIVRIPEDHSDADKLFLKLVQDVLDDEAALY
ncbi:MAG: hypothetical protein C9356_06825 [Oleiphilus sp.]|nr:MAG: hypothetical protein C9356_06825 [Oleiphilus sp.]